MYLHTNAHTRVHAHTPTRTRNAQYCTYGAAREGERQINTEGGWQRGRKGRQTERRGRLRIEIERRGK